ncbi:MAG TPA: zinc ribbon domain-containing protein [Gaiellaceae bacterium]|nr:zinc ribbon domain-containing protein [Gaiellaceae bacterium]
MNGLLFAATPPTTTSSDDGLFDGVNDFFDSGTWLVIRNLAIFFVAVFWLASVVWVYKDARRRIEDPWLVAMATLLGLVPPFIGPLVYLFLRPPEYLEDVRERELEIRAMEERLGRQSAHCPVCRAPVEPEYLLCPVCTTKLKHACVTCKSPLEPLWQVCPYCETPIVRRSPVFDETMALPPEELHAPLRMRRRRRAVGEDTAENLTGEQ